MNIPQKTMSTKVTSSTNPRNVMNTLTPTVSPSLGQNIKNTIGVMAKMPMAFVRNLTSTDSFTNKLKSGYRK